MGRIFRSRSRSGNELLYEVVGSICFIYATQILGSLTTLILGVVKSNPLLPKSYRNSAVRSRLHNFHDFIEIFNGLPSTQSYIFYIKIKGLKNKPEPKALLTFSTVSLLVTIFDARLNKFEATNQKIVSKV